MSVRCFMCTSYPTNYYYKQFCLKTLARHYRKGNSGYSNRGDVGIKKRLQLFSEENPDLEKQKIDQMAFDQLEINAENEHIMLEFEQRKIDQYQKRVELEMIERKYFDKVKNPNFLTWSEKEQIRELHESDPDFWNFNKLSECFPATPDIIKKVVKSSWKFDSSKQIIKHDERVKQNWKKLRKNELQLAEGLKNHLCLFSSRENMQNSIENAPMRERPEKTMLLNRNSEFVKIILNQPEKKMLSPSIEFPGENKSSLLPDNLEAVETTTLPPHLQSGKHTRRKHMTTLEGLRKSLRDEKLPSAMSEHDKAFLNVTEHDVSLVQLPPTALRTDNNENSAVEFNKKQVKLEVSVNEEVLPMRVKVPKNIPKGSVYKVNDVYYDTDGKFLYRVPGMK